MKKCSFWLVFFLVFLFLPSATVFSAPVSRMELVMGTLLQIQADCDDPGAAQKAVDAAFREARRWDDLLSNYKDNSEISRVNREAYPESTVTKTDVVHFLSRAKDLSEATGGAFDITIEPLTLLWNLRGRKLTRVPEGKRIDRAKLKVNYRNLEIYSSDRSVRFLVRGMGIDTGGIGKGYALDRALEKIKSFPLKSVAMNFGGEILYWSREPGERTVAVTDPEDPEKTWGNLSVRIAGSAVVAVSTSASYERFVTVEDGSATKKLGHILDPKTGEPVDHEVRSVTVVSKNAAEADAFSTGIFVMGLEEGKKFAQKRKDILVLILYKNKEGNLESFMSEEWKNLIEDREMK